MNYPSILKFLWLQISKKHTPYTPIIEEWKITKLFITEVFG
jgi:hypothetical protein